MQLTCTNHVLLPKINERWNNEKISVLLIVKVWERSLPCPLAPKSSLRWFDLKRLILEWDLSCLYGSLRFMWNLEQQIKKTRKGWLFPMVYDFFVLSQEKYRPILTSLSTHLSSNLYHLDVVPWSEGLVQQDSVQRATITSFKRLKGIIFLAII